MDEELKQKVEERFDFMKGEKVIHATEPNRFKLVKYAHWLMLVFTFFLWYPFYLYLYRNREVYVVTNERLLADRKKIGWHKVDDYNIDKVHHIRYKTQLLRRDKTSITTHSNSMKLIPQEPKRFKKAIRAAQSSEELSGYQPNE